jgi:hypothetical protein
LAAGRKGWEALHHDTTSRNELLSDGPAKSHISCIYKFSLGFNRKACQTFEICEDQVLGVPVENVLETKGYTNMALYILQKGKIAHSYTTRNKERLNF